MRIFPSYISSTAIEIGFLDLSNSLSSLASFILSGDIVLSPVLSASLVAAACSLMTSMIFLALFAAAAPSLIKRKNFPCGSEIANSSHLKTRSLLRLMLEHDLIKREWLIDYDENKYYYEITPYEGIDKTIRLIKTIPDPFKVIANHEIEKLYKAILTTCEHLMNLYETNPEMF